jgi:hypothetical protein
MYFIMSVFRATPLGGFPSNLVLVIFMKICRENPNLAKSGQKESGNLHEDSNTIHVARRYICMATINTAHSCVTIATCQQYKGKALLSFHGNGGYAPRCNVTNTMPILFIHKLFTVSPN